MQRLSVFLVVFVVAASFACGGSPSNPSGTGTLNVRLTDSPFSAARARNDSERAFPIDGAVMFKRVPFRLAVPPTTIVGLVPGPMAKSISEPGVATKFCPMVRNDGPSRSWPAANGVLCVEEVPGGGTANSDPARFSDPATRPLARSARESLAK